MKGKVTIMGRTRFPYPPCKIGIFSEKPGRHNFEIVRDKDGNALTTVREQDGDSVTYYKVRCTKCGLNDPRAPLH